MIKKKRNFVSIFKIFTHDLMDQTRLQVLKMHSNQNNTNKALNLKAMFHADF